MARGPAGNTLELVVAEDQLTVYGWPGSVVTLGQADTTLAQDVRDSATQDYTLRVGNAQSGLLNCHIEPWAEEHAIAPDTTVDIKAHGPAGDILELVVAEDQLTVYGWTGSVVTLEVPVLPAPPRRGSGSR